MSLQFSEQFGYVTVVCGGEVLVIAGKVVTPKSAAQTPGSSPPTPIVNPLPPPPPPVGATVLAAITRLDVDMDAAIEPAFESLLKAKPFKEFVKLTRDSCVLTITPSSVKTPTIHSTPRVAVTKVGELPFLQNFLTLK